MNSHLGRNGWRPPNAGINPHHRRTAQLIEKLCINIRNVNLGVPVLHITGARARRYFVFFSLFQVSSAQIMEFNLIHVTLIQQWGAHPPSDPSNTFTSIILARHTPGDSHTIPWCEASNLGAIPMAINRPARPNITTCEAGSAWISLMKEMLEMDKQNERKLYQKSYVICFSVQISAVVPVEEPMSGRPPPAKGAALLAA